jgi:flagellar biosynthesis/type III secretory pathway protein FliH
MPYVTSFERIGIAKGREEGLQQGLQQMVLEALDERFGTLSETISDAIHQIQDPAQLRLLILQAIRSESLAEFQSNLNGN